MKNPSAIQTVNQTISSDHSSEEGKRKRKKTKPNNNNTKQRNQNQKSIMELNPKKSRSEVLWV